MDEPLVIIQSLCEIFHDLGLLKVSLQLYMK